MAYSKKWNQPKVGGSASSSGKLTATGGILSTAVIGVLLLLLSGAAWWWFGGRGKVRPVVNVTKPNVTKKAAKSVSHAKPASSTNAPVKPAAIAETASATDNVIRVRHTVQMRTLPDGTQEPVSRPYFSNHVERALSTLCNPGGMAIPLSSALRRFSDAEIMRILKAPMEYDKNDSEFILTRKMEMQRIKEEILDYVAEGHTLREALIEADKTIRRDSSFMMMARISMKEALATGDGELIRAYAKRLNEKLVEKGMKPIEVPPQFWGGEDSGGGVDDENGVANPGN